MNQSKQQYLTEIRSNTAYPAYRGIIGVIVIVGYLLAAFIALGALITGLINMGNSFIVGLGIVLGGLIYAAPIFLGVKFWQEAALILADIGDSVTDANSKNSGGL